MSSRSVDQDFVGQIAASLAGFGRPVGVDEIATQLSERYEYESGDVLAEDIRQVIEAIILCGRASRIVSAEGDRYTFF